MKKENKKYIGIFLIILGISLLIFLPFLTGHMATDSYNIFNKGYKQYNIDNPVVDGRMLTAIMNTIMEHLNIPIIEYSIISLVIAIIISCVAITVIMSTIEKIKKPKNKSSEILLIIASYCTIFNVLYIENLHFVEAAVMACSILFYILAAKIMVQEGKRNTIKSIILLYLGIISYQGSISIFLLSVIVFAMCKNKDIKELIKIIAKAIGITLIGILLNSLQITIVENIFKIKQQRGIKLSTGQKQRLNLIRGILIDKELYFFDEPTSNLDILSEEKITNMIEKYLKDKTYVIVTHRLKLKSLCNKHYIFENHEMREELSETSILN